MKKNNKAFTIIELLVAISIITILVLGTTNINFTRLNDGQKIKIYTNKILINYEKIRNNSLLGKGVGTNLIVPEKWKIEFSNTGSGEINTYYYSGSWMQDNQIILSDFYEIKEIECLSLDGNIKDIFTGSTLETGTLEIQGNNLTLTGSCNNSAHKKLITTISYKNIFEEKIEINTVNGLIKIIK